MRSTTQRHSVRAAALTALGLLAALAVPSAASAAAPDSTVSAAPTSWSGTSSYWGINRIWLASAVDLNAPDTRFNRALMLATMSTNRSRTSSTFTLAVYGAPGESRTFGAHLHEGTCRKMEPAAAGPHYNASTATPPVVDRTTEVWLDVTIGRSGSGSSTATVPFVPRSGERSIVIHESPTDHHGAAGARLVCIPVKL